MRWYVYVYYDEDHQPFYCGKGCGNRAYKAHDVPVPPREQIVLRYFEEEDQAYQLEKDLIAFWGRKDLDPNGRLLNKALGGPGAPGVICSESTCELKSKRMYERLERMTPEERSEQVAKGWRSRSSEERQKRISPMHDPKLKHLREEGRKKAVAKRSLDWIVTSPDGAEQKVTSLRAFTLSKGFPKDALYACAYGSKDNHLGWKARHA